MSEQRVQRRLTAILAADVAGYSQLMGHDEEWTHVALKAHLGELIEPCIAEHRGRVVKTTGDGLLAEFPSVVDAVRCSILVQRGMRERNVSALPDRRIEFRIGVNVGDVIIESDDIYGNGVNVAARLEALAEPGGVCVSGDAYRQVRNRLELDITDLGEQKLKNIAEPVHVYRLRLSDEWQMPSADAHTLPLPDKPSIAVLHFTNMSGDPEQEYFSDGITEDIITALSRLRWFFVIARNSTFVYKGKNVDVKQVGRDLGVRYVLEGSVRKSGQRVRITGQLIDAVTGSHIWAERYDRELVDIFALQDEITTSVTAAIEPRLVAAEGMRAENRSLNDLNAWDLVARAMSRFWHITGADVEAAVAMLKEAIARYPEYAPGHSMLAFCLVLTGHFGWLPMFEVPKLALASARRAVDLDDRDPWAYLALGYVSFVARQTDESAAHFRKAVDLNPNFAAAHGYWGFAIAFDGRSEEAIERLLLAMRMSPHDRQNSIFMSGIAVAHYVAKRYVEAIEWGRKAVQQGPSVAAVHRVLCASLAQAGQMDEARAVLARIRELQAHISLAWAERMVPYTSAQMPHFLDGLRKAGLT